MLKSGIENLDVGITINIQGQDRNTYIQSLINGNLPVFGLGWAPDYPDPDNYVSGFYHSNKSYFFSQTFYQNQFVDSLIDSSVSELDNNERLDLYRNIEEAVTLDYVYMYCFQIFRLDVMRDWVYGYEESGSINPLSIMPNFELIYKQYTSENSTTFTQSNLTNGNSTGNLTDFFIIISDILSLGLFIGLGSVSGMIAAFILRKYK